MWQTGSRHSAWAPCLQEEGELAVTIGDVPLSLRQLLHDQAQGRQGPVDAAGSTGALSECDASWQAWAPSQHPNGATNGVAACFQPGEGVAALALQHALVEHNGGPAASLLTCWPLVDAPLLTLPPSDAHCLQIAGELRSRRQPALQDRMHCRESAGTAQASVPLSD